MAELHDIEIKIEVRPCYIILNAKKKKALFHRWIEKTDMLNHKYTAGIIEYENGRIDEVHYGQIEFCDNKIKSYVFKEGD